MTWLAAKALVVTALALGPSDRLELRGTIVSHHDGARFGPSELVDPEAGGLRVVERRGDVLVLASAGTVGPACAAAGLSSPCLVPRLPELAHARLLSVEELRASLDGALVLETSRTVAPLARPQRPHRASTSFWATTAVLVGLAGLGILWAVRRPGRRALLDEVLAAAAVARRAVRGDETLRAVGLEIDRLVEEARDLDRRRADAERAVPGTGTLATVEETAARDELRARITRARQRLAEIASFLRVVPARLAAARVAGGCADGATRRTVLAELELRARALAEADAVGRDASC
jgi:hypothetical protein